MSWDTSACFKSLCAAYTSFQRQPTDQFAQDLQRQIDVRKSLPFRFKYLMFVLYGRYYMKSFCSIKLSFTQLFMFNNSWKSRLYQHDKTINSKN